MRGKKAYIKIIYLGINKFHTFYNDKSENARNLELIEDTINRDIRNHLHKYGNNIIGIEIKIDEDIEFCESVENDIRGNFQIGIMVHSYQEKMKKQIADIETDKDLSKITIESMGFSIRSYNILKNAGINTLYDLSTKSRYDLKRIPDMDLVPLDEISYKMAMYRVFISEI